MEQGESNISPHEITGRKIREEISQARLRLERVALVELDASHIQPLWEYAQDESIWEHYTFRKMQSYERFEAFLENTINEMKAGREFSFTIIDNIAAKPVGTTSFLDIQPASRSLEIGRTWIAKHLQGTGLNEACKFLLLRLCFEELELIRVFLKTDSNNLRSRSAMEKIGAKYEGTLRNHMIREDGTFRHSAYYSIIREEWEETKEKLEQMI
jgi:RimJ/RimL family protein N-acetyltransferase